MSGRQLIFSAAILWSLSGVFTKWLALPGPIVAGYRVLFGGLFLLFFLKRSQIAGLWDRRLVVLLFFFTVMNVSFVSAMTVTTAANAIFLQYTAPVWMSLVAVYLFKDKWDRKSVLATAVGMVGIAILLAGEWESQLLGVVLGLVSGVAFAGVALSLRWLREKDPVLLTTVETLGSALILLPIVAHQYSLVDLVPSWGAIGVLAAFGIIQLGVPYILFARGLKTVGPQEAGVILLLEPVLNPLWTFLLMGETPSVPTLWGGAFLLGSLVLRYLPPTSRN